MHSLIYTLKGLGEFSTVTQTLDFVSGLHNCLEFTQPLSCLYQAMQTPTFWLKVHVISLNFIAFIISIETEASLLALAKSIDYCHILRRLDIDSKVGKWQISELCKSLKTFKLGKLIFDIFTI